MEKPNKNKPRKNIITEDHLRQMIEMKTKQATNDEVARAIGVHVQTAKYWIKKLRAAEKIPKARMGGRSAININAL